MLTDYRIHPASGGKSKQVVIFLHGVGDSGSGGLLTIGQMWQASLPDCEFLCPDAPFPYDMAPADFGGRQWFSLQSFAPDAILAGVQKAAPILNNYIDNVLVTRNLTPDKLALVGFSQGTIMSLYVAPRRAKSIGCVIGYAGLLAGAESLMAEKKSEPPVLLVHGMLDEVVPYDAMGAADRALRMTNIPVTTISCPRAGHNIDDVGLEEGLKFLKKYLV